jgi:MFS family permease
LAVALLVPTVPSGLVGYALLGLGIAASFPLTLSAAARIPGVAMSTSIAATTAAGYTGFMVGPPLIGFVADVAGLRVGLLVVLACLAVATMLAGRLTDRPAGSAQDAIGTGT